LQANSNYGSIYLNSNTYGNNQASKNQVYSSSNILPSDNGIAYTNQENTNSNYINQSSYFPSYTGQEYVNQGYDSSQYKYNNNNANSNATLASQNVSAVSSGNFQAKKPLTDSILNQTNKRDAKKKPSMAQIKNMNTTSKLEAKKVNSQKSISESLSPLSNTFSSSYLSSTDEQAQIFIADTDGQSDNVESTEDEENEDGDDESEMDDSDEDDDEEEDDGDGDEKAQKDKKSTWNKSALSAPWIQPGEHFKLD